MTAVPEGTRLVLVSEELARLWGTRTESGDRLTFEWGEPDSNGWYTPTFTAHADDNPTQGLREAAEAALTDFVFVHGSDFDAVEFPGMAWLRSLLRALG
jgi:hypothetical protein